MQLDVDSAYQIVELLDRFVHWLDGPSMTAAEDCTRAMSMGECADPETISGWADSLAGHLEYLADISRREHDTRTALR